MSWNKFQNQIESPIKRYIVSVVFGILNISLLIIFIFILKSGFDPLVGNAATGINKMLNFRGTLRDTNGAIVSNGDYSMIFTIYDASTSGNCLYTAKGTCVTPTAKTISVTNGVFTTAIGDTDNSDNALTLNFNSDTYWLGLTIQGDSELTPRVRIGASGYAFNADLLDGLNTSSNGGNNSYITATDNLGNLTLTGTPNTTLTSGAVLYINPPYATSTQSLLGLAVNGEERFRVNASGTVYASGTIYSAGSIETKMAFSDSFGWKTNSREQAELMFGRNNSWGGSLSPGSNFTTTTNWATFDASDYGIGAINHGYAAAAFDGRYIYFVPNGQNSTGTTYMHGQVLRYDTSISFATTSAWTAYDPSANGVGTDPDGYYGVVFDGTYLYFVPYNNTDGGATYLHGEVLRYNTKMDFATSTSWTTYDAGANGVGTDPDGFAGAVFDGRYIYFVPQYNGTGHHGEVMRYDTNGNFDTAGSWKTYDPGANGVGTDPDGFAGAVFDGRYIYFIPFNNGTSNYGEVMRYDTNSNFDTAGSWTTYDAGANGVGTDPDGFISGVFDGRYIYFVPYHNGSNIHGEVMRYDTNGNFSASSSWLTFDPGANGVGTDPDGFSGGVFDGRYIYFVPNNNGTSRHGEVMRYDTTGRFNDTISWTTYDAGANGVGTDPDGFEGGIFDGRYVYFVPSNNGTNYHGEVMRYDTGSPYPQQGIAQVARSKDFFIDSVGNIGIGTTTPLAQLHIKGLDNEIQFRITASSTQTTNIFQIENSASSPLVWISQTGNFGVSGTIEVGYGNVSSTLMKNVLNFSSSSTIQSAGTSTFISSLVDDTNSSSSAAFVFNTSNSYTNTNILSIRENGTNFLNVKANGAIEVGILGTQNSTSTFYGNISASGTISSTCSGSCLDIAEQYISLDKVEAGDVVAIAEDADGMQNGSLVKKSSKQYEKNILGVVSTNPGLVLSIGGQTQLGGGGSGTYYQPNIALAGRVPVKVSNENGAIMVGDYLTSAGRPGYAMKAIKSGTIIGRALSSFDGEDETGKIIVFVAGGWYNGKLAEDGDLSINTQNDFDLQALPEENAILRVDALISYSGAWELREDGSFIAKFIEADKIVAKQFSVSKNAEIDLVGNTLDASVGEGFISESEYSVVIYNNRVKSNSKIFIAFNDNAGGPWWISKKGNGWFEVEIISSMGYKVRFDYWILDVVTELVEETGISSSTPNNTSTSTPVSAILVNSLLDIGGENTTSTLEIIQDEENNSASSTEEILDNSLLDIGGENTTSTLEIIQDEENNSASSTVLE